MSARFTRYSVCLHGLAAEDIRLRRDERHNALYIVLDYDNAVDIRVDLNDPGADMERDRQGLLRLAEAAAQAAEEIGQLQRGGDEGQADEDDETYTCSTCGALIGMFTGRQGWQHFRGEGTTASPVEIYDAGHEATPGGWLP